MISKELKLMIKREPTISFDKEISLSNDSLNTLRNDLIKNQFFNVVFHNKDNVDIQIHRTSEKYYDKKSKLIKRQPSFKKDKSTTFSSMLRLLYLILYLIS